MGVVKKFYFYFYFIKKVLVTVTRKIWRHFTSVAAQWPNGHVMIAYLLFINGYRQFDARAIIHVIHRGQDCFSSAFLQP